MRINILVNAHRQDAIEAACRTASWLLERNVEVGIEQDVVGIVPGIPVFGQAVAQADLVITFGGDGTLIRAAHLCSERGTPILGVYYGRFGFVTQCQPQELGAALSQFFDGKARIEDRIMLQTDLMRGDRSIVQMHCLNEAALQRAATTRMLTFEVRVDSYLLTRYPADGVLVSTPTGSTAYNLSAGGPILDPRLDGMVVTAITPHTLSSRPLVLRPDAVVDMRMETRGDAVLSCDGQCRHKLLSGDAVRVTRSPRVTRLISIEPHDFVMKLSDRLLWSKGLISDDE